jgi:hypothetical protein
VALLERQLYGFHPGVEFRDREGQLIGEADLVLLFVDGGIALGECKLTPRGLRQADISKLETLAGALNAAWTFYAVAAWREDCGDVWQGLERDLPERPCFVLTNEQLLQASGDVSWALGENPLRAEPATASNKEEFHNQFVRRLAGSISWLEKPKHWDDHLLEEEE